MRMLKQFWDDEAAATAVEYSVMLALILLSIIAAVSSVGGENAGMWSGVEQDLDAVGFGN